MFRLSSNRIKFAACNPALSRPCPKRVTSPRVWPFPVPARWKNGRLTIALGTSIYVPIKGCSPSYGVWLSIELANAYRPQFRREVLQMRNAILRKVLHIMLAVFAAFVLAGTVLAQQQNDRKPASNLLVRVLQAKGI